MYRSPDGDVLETRRRAAHEAIVEQTSFLSGLRKRPFWRSRVSVLALVGGAVLVLGSTIALGTRVTEEPAPLDVRVEPAPRRASPPAPVVPTTRLTVSAKLVGPPVVARISGDEHPPDRGGDVVLDAEGHIARRGSICAATGRSLDDVVVGRLVGAMVVDREGRTLVELRDDGHVAVRAGRHPNERVITIDLDGTLRADGNAIAPNASFEGDAARRADATLAYVAVSVYPAVSYDLPPMVECPLAPRAEVAQPAAGDGASPSGG